MPATITPLGGDRSAFDVTNHANKHASDLQADTPIHHVPAGNEIGDTLRWDGTKWEAVTLSAQAIVTMLTREGDLEVGTSPLKIANKWGGARTITNVYATVNSAPTGDDVIIDIYKNGYSIFLEENRVVIADGVPAGQSMVIEYPVWDNEFLTFGIIQIGSTYSGADLVIHISHTG